MKKKLLVITGANKGIGLETVKKFVDENWYVCACVRNVSSELRSLIKNSGEIFNLELKSEDSIKLCAKSILSKFERVDTLINCAGIAYGNLFAMTKIQNLREVFEINFFSQILFSQLISKKMMQKKSGVIINLSSTASIIADDGTLAYGSSKAALSQATKVMAKELGKFQIRVNAIAPAFVETEMGMLMDKKSIELLNERGSLKGNILPKDITELLFFLSSDKSKHISGQIIRVDKGMPF